MANRAKPAEKPGCQEGLLRDAGNLHLPAAPALPAGSSLVLSTRAPGQAGAANPEPQSSDEPCGDLLCAAPGFSTRVLLLGREGRRGKRQTDSAVHTTCLKPNPGVTGELFLIKHYFPTSSETPRGRILLKSDEQFSSTCW